IVSTADITDATPAGESSHSANRQTRFEIARQYLNNPFLNGKPGFDVIIGGGTDQFAACRNDGLNLIRGFQDQGYKYVTTASDLAALNPASKKVLALLYSIPGNKAKSNGVQCNLDGNMTVAYDKLGLVRPASEVPTPFDGNTDQPFLDAMTKEAISFLSSGGRPFILMVEAASIDKQSHANMASGQIWDTIEFDKAIGVGRTWAAKNGNTLVLVTADHDQSLIINGVSQVPQENYVDKNMSEKLVYNSPGAGEQTATYFQDSSANIRSAYPLISSSDPNGTGKATGPEFGPFQNPITESNFPNYVDSDGDGYPDNVNLGTTGNIRLSVGYRSGNHTGSSVPVTAEGPGAFLFTGYMDQSDIMFKAAVSLGGDTTAGDVFVKTVLLNPMYPQTPGKNPLRPNQ
ncbi:MAG: alkaline phosphatase, partial [Acidobacteriaceae bacterium]|nr:alkaline phosphatase [Acidobacteriaceae bacterium]